MKKSKSIEVPEDMPPEVHRAVKSATKALEVLAHSWGMSTLQLTLTHEPDCRIHVKVRAWPDEREAPAAEAQEPSQSAYDS